MPSQAIVEPPRSGPHRVPVQDLSRFIARALAAVGLPEPDAARVGALMAEADARGADGHGVFRLPQYVRRIKAGGINVRPQIKAVRAQRSALFVTTRMRLSSSTRSSSCTCSLVKASAPVESPCRTASAT